MRVEKDLLDMREKLRIREQELRAAHDEHEKLELRINELQASNAALDRVVLELQRTRTSKDVENCCVVATFFFFWPRSLSGRC